MNLKVIASATALAALSLPALAASRILAPVDGYVSGSDRVWVVVESEKPPTVELDGVKVRGTFTEDGKVRHIRVGKISASGSVIKVDGLKAGVAYEKGGPGAGDPLFHGVQEKNCSSCHETGSSCKDCHAGYGSGKHGTSDFAKKCASCHEKKGIPSSEEAVKLCSGCHEKYSLTKHPRLRHPVAGKNDPTRPGRRMDCVSCHDPHGPRDLSADKNKEWCKDCHANP